MDIPEKLTTPVRQDEEKQNKNTTQYVLDHYKHFKKNLKIPKGYLSPNG